MPAPRHPVPSPHREAEPTPSPAGEARLAPPVPEPGDPPGDGRPLAAAAALRAELIGAVDHDLRTALTTVLGALQTMARPELVPADPDLAGLLSSGLAQAQKMRRLLDELLDAAAPDGSAPLLPAGLTHLIRQAAGPGDGGSTDVAVPGDLAPVGLSPLALRRALAAILSRARGRSGVRVQVADESGDCCLTISAAGGEPPAVPVAAARLVTAMGGRFEQAGAVGSPAVRLVFPGACRPPPASG